LSVLGRVRVRLDARANPYLGGVVQMQDSRRFGSEPTTVADLHNVDLHQGYLELRPLGSEALRLQAGRLELAYGAERLIGTASWDNVARSFDALRLQTRPSASWGIDAFYARLHDDRTVARAIGDDLVGVYLSWACTTRSLDLYSFYTHDGGGQADSDGDGMPEDRLPGGEPLHLWTGGGRAAHKAPTGFRFEIEAAVQAGKRGHLDVLAYALHADIGYAAPSPGGRELTLGGNLASGDDDPLDGNWNTFDNLFPSNHLAYGRIDLAAWKNLAEVYAGFASTPVATIKLETMAHIFWRMENGDTFYRASGAPLRKLDVAGMTGRKHVGTELDVNLTWSGVPGLKVLLGGAAFLAGDFLDDTDGGDAPNPVLGYLQMLATF
jgi:hypothetical protein